MEKVIELENEVRPSRLLNSELFKIIKLCFIGGAFLVGADLGRQGWDLANVRWSQYLTERVTESLEGKTFEFDTKRAVAKPVATMSREELLKAIYILNESLESKQQLVEHLKETLSYE